MGSEEELMAPPDSSAPDVRVYLRVAGTSQSPDEITRLVGMEPDESWEMGKLIRPDRPGRIAKFHGWKVTSGLSRSATVEEQVNALRRRLAGSEAALSRLAASNDIELVVVPDCPPGTSRYGYALDRAALSFVAEVGGAVDADEYFPREGFREELPDDLEDPRVRVSLTMRGSGQEPGEERILLDSGLPPTAPVDDHLDAIRRLVEEEGALPENRPVPEGADVLLSVVVELPPDNDTYGLHLDEDMVRLLARLGAGVVVDHHLEP